ncbi:alpha/beta fold hydrolase [Burkholderia gladioli]|uniref:alpha/beta fold hydrolase n=1 Tax=Burkholderia gladioli TaxID=28095 RepID=UPI00163EEE74|nr:alpha/beta hydrolase [Burkholderia gladioli]
MSDPIHRELSVDGVRLHLVEQGKGPAVLLCHGYPECWYSWRHQLPALAAAGYRAIALDMRGYGESDSPPGIEDYTVLRLVGDLVGVLDALGIESAVVAGHDWGAVVAWHAALLRADRFQAVIALSVPFIPRGQVSTSRKLPETEHEVFYQLYFQEPGVAEADYERDTRGYLRGLLFATSGDMPPPAEGEPPRRPGMVPRTGRLPYSGPAVLPAWLGEADVDVYTAAFARNGFRGPLNWYRNIERNWQTLAAFEGRKVEVPALYIAGERDLVLAFKGNSALLEAQARWVPRLARTVRLPGCGHWTQQERPAEVNREMLAFLGEVGWGRG